MMLDAEYLEVYPKYSNMEKLTCIIDLALEDELSRIDYRYYFSPIVIEKKESSLKYYWVDRGIKTHEVAINNIKKYDSQKIKQLIIIQYDLLKVEMIVGKDWPHTGNVHSLFEVDGNEVFLLIVAKRRDYPESEIWRHFFDVFAENWQNFFQDNDLETILKIP